MKWPFISLVLVPLISLAAPARKIVVKKDEVVVVKTAVGIATIIQVPDQPVSVVLGDSGSFKVEYLNQAVTIKPLRHGAASNLYIHTDYDRFSIKLASTTAQGADYVVYLAPFVNNTANRLLPLSSPLVKWTDISSTKKSDLGSVSLKRVGRAPDYIYVDLAILPSQNGKFDPAVFWLIQGKETRSIQEIFLSSLEQKSNQPLSATLALRKADLVRALPVSIEVRSRQKIAFLLPARFLWQD